jgi:hypothetical protein
VLPPKRWLSLSALTAGLGCLFACSYLYEVSFDVALDPSLASRTGTVILEPPPGGPSPGGDDVPDAEAAVP